VDVVERDADGDPLLSAELNHLSLTHLLSVVPDGELLDIPLRLLRLSISSARSEMVT
jgi:hypothetical protein